MSSMTLKLNHQARESGFFRSSDNESLLQRLRDLVKRGIVDEAVLKSAEAKFKAPTVINKPEFARFEYVKGVTPVPGRPPSGAMGNLGNQVNMGRMRWTSDGVSIFSVSDGKELASTPAKPLNHYDNIRMNKIQKAAMQTPTVAGYRLLPEMTPGRWVLELGRRLFHSRTRTLTRSRTHCVRSSPGRCCGGRFSRYTGRRGSSCRRQGIWRSSRWQTCRGRWRGCWGRWATG